MWRAGAWLIGLLCCATFAAANGQGDLSANVREILIRHCGECHGAQLAKPKAKLGYIADLARLVDEGLVAPESPDDSEVYKVLVHEDQKFRMPPRVAKAGPLSAEQIALVREWIVAGAEAGTAAPSDSGGSPVKPVAAPPAPPPPLPMSERVLAFAGRFHVLTVHFPIALLLVGALAELASMLPGRAWARDAARLCVPIGAAGAAAAAVLGLLSAQAEGFAPETVFAHQWLGIAAAGVALIAAIMQRLSAQRGSAAMTAAYRAVLLAAAGLVGVAAHFGGVIVHGEDHFRF